MSLLLGLLGLGGTGALGVVGWLLGWHRSRLAQRAGELARRVPTRAWLILGGVALLVGLAWLHQHRMHQMLDDAYHQGRADQISDDDRAAAAIGGRAVALTEPISAENREKHDEALRTIHTAGDAQRLRGPGAAVCRDPALSVPSGQHDGAAGGTGDAAMARLPYPDGAALLAVPFDDATRFAEQHDALRDEVVRWHDWYPRMRSAWDALAAETASPGPVDKGSRTRPHR